MTREDLQVRAAGYVLAWLRQDYWTCARIAAALEDEQVPAGQVAEVLTLAAASMLADALGAGAAAEFADRWVSTQAARQVRLLSAAS